MISEEILLKRTNMKQEEKAIEKGIEKVKKDPRDLYIGMQK